MKILRSPTIAAAIATVLAGTTGYCHYRTSPPDEPPPVPLLVAPIRLLPEAVLPYPLEEPE